MKFITKGKLPSVRIYQVQCGHCRTIFQAAEGEGEVHDCQREGRSVEFRCPLSGCGQRCFGYKPMEVGAGCAWVVDQGS